MGWRGRCSPPPARISSDCLFRHSVAGGHCRPPLRFRPVMILLAPVDMDRRLDYRALPLMRPTVTTPSSLGNSPDWVERSSVGSDEKVHRSDEQWQSPRLPNLGGQCGVDNAILSRRPRCHDQDASWSVEVPRGASAAKVLAAAVFGSGANC